MDKERSLDEKLKAIHADAWRTVAALLAESDDLATIEEKLPGILNEMRRKVLEAKAEELASGEEAKGGKGCPSSGGTKRRRGNVRRG